MKNIDYFRQYQTTIIDYLKTTILDNFSQLDETDFLHKKTPLVKCVLESLVVE